MSCQNNLKQIGIALHHYHDDYGKFPPGRNVNPVNGQGRCFSAYAYLLPYLEADNLYTQIVFTANPDTDPVNAFVLDSTIPYFQCPSDQHNKLQGLNAVHNYPLNTGTTYSVSPRNPSGNPVTGIFFENSKVRFADILDGTSQTVCVSETVLSDPSGPTVWDGVSPTNGFVLTRGNNNLLTGPELIDYASQCSGAGLVLQQTRGSKWLYGAPGHSMYNHMRTPNDPNVDCRGGIPHSNKTDALWRVLSLNVTAHSRHPGGVNALFCDGHVKFISNNIALAIWQALGTRSGQEPIVDGDY
jgi:prepilin-type processing-associated H-X9-DG protein